MAEFYENIILPMRGEVMAATRKQELGQLLSMDDLLLAADEELLSQLAAVRALRDYWISRSRLERAAACDLGQLPPSGAALAWLRWAPAELAGPPGHAGGMISIDGSGPEAEEGLAAREAELLMARPDRD